MFFSTTFLDYKIFFSSVLIFWRYLWVEYFIENFFMLSPRRIVNYFWMYGNHITTYKDFTLEKNKINNIIVFRIYYNQIINKLFKYNFLWVQLLHNIYYLNTNDAFSVWAQWCNTKTLYLYLLVLVSPCSNPLVLLSLNNLFKCQA